MAVRTDERPATGLTSRRFLDEPVMCLRDAAGHPQALADRRRIAPCRACADRTIEQTRQQPRMMVLQHHFARHRAPSG